MLGALLVGAPVAFGAWDGWALTGAFVLIGVAAAAWLASALGAGLLEWRRTPLDLPLALLLPFVLVQLAVGNGRLVAWALAPAAPVTEIAARLPAPFLTIGSVSPHQGLVSVLVFAGYAAVYLLVVQLVRTRRQVSRLVRALLLVGAFMALVGLFDYMTGGTWVPIPREQPSIGRLSATFVNPDHFAAWLAMLIALGLGWLVARSPGRRRAPSLRESLSVRELREQAARRYLPLLGVMVMGLALVFTLSRGGLVNLVVALVALIVMLGAVGRARRSLVLTGLLLVIVVAYGGWIGFGPLLGRLAQTPEGRPAAWSSTSPRCRCSPSSRSSAWAWAATSTCTCVTSRSPTRRPGSSIPTPTTTCCSSSSSSAWSAACSASSSSGAIAGDLVRAHLLGRGACPVDGGEGEAAMRNDPYSLGVAVGALAGLAGLLAHSTLDFAARIPAVGFLAAALLGLATVALHTRLQQGHEQLLSGSPSLRCRAHARPPSPPAACSGWSRGPVAGSTCTACGRPRARSCWRRPRRRPRAWRPCSRSTGGARRRWWRARGSASARR